MTENGISTTIATFVVVAGLVELHRVGLDGAEAVHPGDELVEEDVAPHLAVGDDVRRPPSSSDRSASSTARGPRLVLATRPGRASRRAWTGAPRPSQLRAQHRADDIGVVDHWSPLSVHLFEPHTRSTTRAWTSGLSATARPRRAQFPSAPSSARTARRRSRHLPGEIASCSTGRYCAASSMRARQLVLVLDREASFELSIARARRSAPATGRGAFFFIIARRSRPRARRRIPLHEEADRRAGENRAPRRRGTRGPERHVAGGVVAPAERGRRW